MEKFMGLLMLVMGIGLVAVAFQGASKGWLPNGPNGFKQGKGVSKEENPIGFWFFFTLYSAGGAYIVILALQALAGHGPLAIR
jgi:hypothetical protein